MAAAVVAEVLGHNPRAVLALPTGNTPLSLYQRLVYLHRKDSVTFSAVTTFNLDEYHGLAPDDPASYAAYMHREFFDHVDINPQKVHLLNSLATDAEAECRAYEEEIRRAGGLDLAILGIGRNGHIAFNEPGSDFASRTRRVQLTDQTIADNKSLFADPARMPRFALTMGIGTILEARRVLLLASGRKKAEILAKALRGEVNTDVPASVLQLHPKLTVIADKAAAEQLMRPSSSAGQEVAS